MKEHPHGDINRYRHGRCRCKPCRAANAAAARDRRREIAYGRYQPDADAEQVRAHVLQLRADGMQIQQIANRAGVSIGIVCTLLYGRPSQGVPPSRKMRPANAEKLLAVTAGSSLRLAS